MKRLPGRLKGRIIVIAIYMKGGYVINVLRVRRMRRGGICGSGRILRAVGIMRVKRRR